MIRRMDATAFHAMSFELARRGEISQMIGASVHAPTNVFAASCPRLGWGRRPSGQRAMRGQEFLLLEDGPVRSSALGDPILSLRLDQHGVYYDLSHASAFESSLAQPLHSEATERVQALAAQWRNGRISKFNHLPEYRGALPDRFVLVVDQVAGDLSLKHGGGDAQAFERMITAALDENPECKVLVKAHPKDTTETSHLRRFRDRDPRLLWVDAKCHPTRLIENAQAVYVVTSQMGLEAMIWGKPVRCFGNAYYAGLGLTEDDAAERLTRVSTENLLHAFLVADVRYYDPERRVVCSPETAFERIAVHRAAVDHGPVEATFAGFSPRKQRRLRVFLPGTRLAHSESSPDIVWGAAPANPGGLSIEDGMMRSVGLGAARIPARSWIFDDLGPHYDPVRPSRLEHRLNTAKRSAADIARARRFLSEMVAHGATKYGLRGRAWNRPEGTRDVRLVVGQVESDAALSNQPGPRTNLALIQAARARHPKAHLIYRPHPDVTAGLRRPGKDERAARDLADSVEPDADLDALLAGVDAVDTISSGLGFEALMRGVAVTCYGLPFYAAWGLTEDIYPLPRRSKRLSIEDLVFEALIKAPRYVSATDTLISPEAALAERIWEQSRPKVRLEMLPGAPTLLRFRSFLTQKS